MKKLTLAIIACLISVSTFAQTNQSGPQRLKYVTMAPDGSVALTIYDDSSKENMKLEASDSFYKYQLLDTKTNEPVYSSRNNGSQCEIDKSKIAAGDYNIRLYTSNFVITSKIKVSAARKLVAVISEDGVAMND